MKLGAVLLSALIIPGLAEAGKYDLHDHVMSGDVEKVAETAADSQINRFDKEGATPLHYGALNANVDIVEILIANGALVNLANEESGTTALHEIARSRSRDRTAIRETIVALAAAGANPNLVDGYEDDALTAAARAGNGAAVRAMLKELGDSMSDQSLISALTVARENGRYESMHALESHGVSSDSGLGSGLLSAAEAGNFGVLSEIVEKGPDLEFSDEDGNSPLIHAAGGGHWAALDLLLAAGANVGATRSDGQQALHVAAHGGHKDTIDRLISGGASVNAVSSALGTPVNRAAEREQVNIVNHLLAIGAKPVSVESDAERSFGSGFAWQLYAAHNQDSLDIEEYDSIRLESDRLLGIARTQFKELRDEREEQLEKLVRSEKRWDRAADIIAGVLAIAIVGTVENLQQKQIRANQRQTSQILALQGAKSYPDYNARLNAYENVMVNTQTGMPFQVDLTKPTYVNTSSDFGLGVIISEYERRIVLIDHLLVERPEAEEN